VDRLKGHSKKVTAVRFHPSADFGGLILTGASLPPSLPPFDPMPFS